ncbi:hypothetical protein C4544_07595 [candidate division WS5 bacterium]|uniref:DUF5658 domain-containing protein n=1 Tax=candidate division WS5 bacterium TaxID=2093353 RepID=A0A419D9W4_9BACT|nr:MAG: hypothetical protein C4544_07595 [candidate division WS5 bacterium]
MNSDIIMLSVENNSRLHLDRRKCPTPIISRYTFYGGRRRKARREEERKTFIYVDLYSTRLLVAVMFLLLLSCLDAYLTLELIGRGHVVEANPVMAFFLEYGPTPFTVVKFVITASCLTILCLFKNVKVTRICLPFAIKMYLLVIAYEFYLFWI